MTNTMILTDIGRNKIAQAAAVGGVIKFSKFSVGDANGIPYVPTGKETKLANQKYITAIGSVNIDEKNPDTIKIAAVIPESTGGYQIREMGIFDIDNQLIAIGVCEAINKPDPKEAAYSIAIKIRLSIKNATAVGFNIEMEGYVTYEYLLNQYQAQTKNIVDKAVTSSKLADDIEIKNSLKVPNTAIDDVSTKAANMAAINQAVNGATSKNLATEPLNGVITLTAAEARAQWLSLSGVPASDVIIDIPTGIIKTFAVSCPTNLPYNIFLRRVGQKNTYQIYAGISFWILTSSGCAQLSSISGTLYGNSYYSYDITINDSSYRVANTAFVQNAIKENAIPINKTSIPAKADLNDFVLTGIYFQNANGNAANGINYPAPLAGMLEVFNLGSMLYQCYTVYSCNTVTNNSYDVIYIRGFYSTGWSPWKKQANLSDDQDFTGVNTVPTPLIIDKTKQIANMAAINQAVTGYTSIDISSVGQVLTITEAQYRLQWLDFSGTLKSDLIIDIPTGFGKTITLSNNVVMGNYSINVRRVGYSTVRPLPSGCSLWVFNGSSGVGYLSALYSANLTGNSYYNYDIATNDNGYRLANTAFVQALASLMGKLAGNNIWKLANTFEGETKVPAITGTTDNSTKAAPTSFVQAVAALKANLISPAFTGSPTAPTVENTDNSQKLVTTAHLKNLFTKNAAVGIQGYQILPTGVCIAWCSLSASTAGQNDFPVVYPVTFTTVYQAVASASYMVGAWAVSRNSKETTASGSTWIMASSGSDQYTRSISVLVIGKLSIANTSPEYYLYSSSTNGFYLPLEENVTLDLPSDVVRIELNEYEELFKNQALGLAIKPNKNGRPISVPVQDNSDWDMKNELWVINSKKLAQFNYINASTSLRKIGDIINFGYTRDFNENEILELFEYQDELRAYLKNPIGKLPKEPLFISALAINYLDMKEDEDEK